MFCIIKKKVRLIFLVLYNIFKDLICDTFTVCLCSTGMCSNSILSFNYLWNCLYVFVSRKESTACTKLSIFLSKWNCSVYKHPFKCTYNYAVKHGSVSLAVLFLKFLWNADHRLTGKKYIPPSSWNAPPSSSTTSCPTSELPVIL